MAFFRRQNQTCLGGNHVSWWIIKTLVDAGWTIPLSGSGSGGIYSAANIYDMAQSPKQWSLLDPNNQGVGSEPWGHPYCWAILEDPAGNRQYAFMRDSAASDAGDDEWYVGYSPGGRFGEGQTAGVDWDQDTLPAAPDQYDLLGTPTAWSIIWKPGGTRSLIHVVADSTPSSEGEYGIFMVEFTGVNSQDSAFVIDPLNNAPVGHVHPVTNYVSGFDGTFNVGNLNENTHFYTIFDFGGGSEARVTINYLYARYGNTSEIPIRGGVGVDGKERALRCPVGFENGMEYMGISKWLAWSSVSHGYPMTANGGKDVFIGDMVFPDLLDGTEAPRTI